MVTRDQEEALEAFETWIKKIESRKIDPINECRHMWETDDPDGCAPSNLPVHMCSQRQGHKGAHVCRDCGTETA